MIPAKAASAAKRRKQTPKPFEMSFDISTIKHLGLQMYSTLPPVIGELVSNAWDANARVVRVTVPTDLVTDASEIVATGDGDGMTEKELRDAYLVVRRSPMLASTTLRASSSSFESGRSSKPKRWRE